jgi:hypothetical protein
MKKKIWRESAMRYICRANPKTRSHISEEEVQRLRALGIIDSEGSYPLTFKFGPASLDNLVFPKIDLRQIVVLNCEKEGQDKL